MASNIDNWLFLILCFVLPFDLLNLNKQYAIKLEIPFT